LTLGFGQSHWFAFLNIMLPVVGLVPRDVGPGLDLSPQDRRQQPVLPGASAATNLWWRLTLIFGIYVRKMQFGLLYGTLAAVIRVMGWMELCATIIFLGASWNAVPMKEGAVRVLPDIRCSRA